MINALIVSMDKTVFSDVETALVENGIKVDWCDSGTLALSMLMEEPNDLVVADETLPDMTGRSFIEKVIMTNPMINCVVASSYSKKDFHEVYEGLGVLMQFPVAPGRKEAQELIEYLKKIRHLQAMP
jgi:two-component SAPR family response regulator